MADSAVDLFKFVSLRSAAEPPSSQLVRTQITDGRIAAPARDAPPEVTADAPSFEKSAAATKVYKAVRAAVANITFILGHEDHGHPLSTSAGCTGSFQTFLDPGHAGAGNLSAVFVAQYTDLGAPGVPSLTGSDEVVLVPNP